MADFYGTFAGFVIYHTARNRAAEIAEYEQLDVEGALLIVSEWIDVRYRSAFPGLKVGMREQVREWPREGGSDRYGYAIPSTSVPTEVENAAYELALRQLVTPGGLTVDFTPNKYKRVAVDGAVSAEYASFNSAADAQTQYLIIDQILSGLLWSGGLSSPLSGMTARV